MTIAWHMKSPIHLLLASICETSLFSTCDSVMRRSLLIDASLVMLSLLPIWPLSELSTSILAKASSDTREELHENEVRSESSIELSEMELLQRFSWLNDWSRYGVLISVSGSGRSVLASICARSSEWMRGSSYLYRARKSLSWIQFDSISHLGVWISSARTSSTMQVQLSFRKQ